MSLEQILSKLVILIKFFCLSRCLFLVLATVAAVFSVEITTPSPTVECTTQNCIISFSKMDDKVFEDMIPDEKSEILALKFSSCQMEKLPTKVFDKFPTLLCLMTTTPGLKSLDSETFLSATNLQFLYLPGNQIKKLNPQSFRGASNLNEINLTDNEIEVVSEDAFEGLEHLESLSLARNQIAFFGQETFTPMSDLMNLDISGNSIEFLDSRLFMNNEKLNGINIADNQIVAITNGFLKLLPQIKVLNVMNNPCTSNTMLENIPLIKIIDSKDLNSEDESSLDRCYRNYIEMADPESTDLNDLLEEAEVTRDDIEGNIIADITAELQEKDEIIKTLELRLNVVAIIIVSLWLIFIFYYIMKAIVRIVNSTYQQKLNEKLESSVEVLKTDPKQVVYTIEV